jgi:hypothetical protein
MRFLTVLGQPGKAVLRFSWTEVDFIVPRPPTGHPELGMTHAKIQYQRTYLFPQMPDTARSTSSQFYQERHTVCQLLQR